MSIDLVCPQCGHHNRVVGVFCAKCGARMGTPEIETRAERASAAGLLGGLVRLLFALAVLGVVGLLLWPVRVPVAPAGEGQVESYLGKLAGLRDAIEAGHLTAEVFTEAEINGFLAKRLAGTAGAGEARGLRLALHALHVNVSDRLVTVTVLAGYGPVRLSYQVSGQPVIGTRQVTFPLASARVGHLPFPGPAGNWVASKVMQAFTGLEEERFVLDHVEQCDLAVGRLRLVTPSSAP